MDRLRDMKHLLASEVLNKDVISHFVLPPVYCRTEELRKWFLSMETALFRYQFLLLKPEAQRALLAEFGLPYRAVASAELEVPFEEVPELVADCRVFILKGCFSCYSISQSSIKGALSNKQIVEALCSSYLGPDYSQLRGDHHLNHGGRMQLGLFLKGVRLKLDDALAFWKTEFSQKDYTPCSCQKIIYLTPGGGDHHGCPYRNLSGAVEDVMDKVRNRHYQLACTLTFEAIHGVSCDAGINHPNQYFSDSQKILKSKSHPSE